MSEPKSTPGTLWRDLYPVHPCADVFPMMSDAELDALAADIKQHGLRNPIVISRADDDAPTFVLDGRNRLAALQRLGARLDVEEDNKFVLPDGTEHRPLLRLRCTDDPAAYVISANIMRRHLTKELQAELIVRTIEAAKDNDRANVARSFSPTAGARGGSTKDPVLDKAVTEAAKHGISKRTVQNARAKVHGTKKTDATPLSDYERIDQQLTENAKLLDRVLRVYTELNATLTGAERRTIRDRLTAARRRIDQQIIQFGGAHKPTPDAEVWERDVEQQVAIAGGARG